MHTCIPLTAISLLWLAWPGQQVQCSTENFTEYLDSTFQLLALEEDDKVALEDLVPTL